MGHSFGYWARVVLIHISQKNLEQVLQLKGLCTNCKHIAHSKSESNGCLNALSVSSGN